MCLVTSPAGAGRSEIPPLSNKRFVAIVWTGRCGRGYFAYAGSVRRPPHARSRTLGLVVWFGVNLAAFFVAGFMDCRRNRD